MLENVLEEHSFGDVGESFVGLNSDTNSSLRMSQEVTFVEDSSFEEQLLLEDVCWNAGIANVVRSLPRHLDTCYPVKSTLCFSNFSVRKIRNSK